VYRVDQGWIEKTGVKYSLDNASTVKTSLLVSTIVPAGTPINAVAPLATEGSVWSVVFSPDGNIIIAPARAATQETCLSATMVPTMALP
jgi:hypothetical protein